MKRQYGWYIFILIIVTAGIYWFWNDGQVPFLNGKKLTFDFAENFPRIAQNLPGFSDDFTQSSKKTIKEAVNFLTEGPQEVATNVLNEVKETATNSTKEQLARVLNLPAPKPTNFGIVHQVNDKFVLLIKSDSDGLRYAIDWADGEVTNGELPANQEKRLEHIWQKSEDFIVKVELESLSGEKKTFSFPVKATK